MKLCFQTQRSYNANIIERGDKHDQSIVHLLSTLPSKAFLVEKKGGLWTVTTGVVSVSQEDPVIVLSSQNVVKEVIAKPKYVKPKKKKG